MHNEICVRLGYGLEHFEEEMDAGMRIQMMPVAISVYLIAVNILENEVRLPALLRPRRSVLQCARVQEAQVFFPRA